MRTAPSRISPRVVFRNAVSRTDKLQYRPLRIFVLERVKELRDLYRLPARAILKSASATFLSRSSEKSSGFKLSAA